MFVDLKGFKLNSTVAVATSGGSDSMALLHFLFNNSNSLNLKIVCVNVEHGIRGASSLKDSAFVKDFCSSYGIPFYGYTVDALKKAENEKLSVETAARILRYDCYYDLLNKNLCDVICTAHHLRDNAESVLLNICRGTGIKGLIGITEYSDKILRPLIKTPKNEIDEYVKENAIPFVVDETNLKDDYSRNYLRHNVIPAIERIFPDFESSVLRLSEIAKTEDEFLDEEAKKHLVLSDGKAQIRIPLHKALFNRAGILALKFLGVEKDWAKIHIDDLYALSLNANGKKLNLPKDIVAFREYDYLTLVKNKESVIEEIPFSVGEFNFGEQTLKIENINIQDNYYNGLYLDLGKIPNNAVIRTKKDGDKFTKFGGGTKSLSDYLTDKKIPLRKRDNIPLIASGNTVLALFGVAISEQVKITEETKNIIKISITKEG